jgi:hypothetical protein
VADWVLHEMHPRANPEDYVVRCHADLGAGDGSAVRDMAAEPGRAVIEKPPGARVDTVGADEQTGGDDRAVGEGCLRGGAPSRTPSRRGLSAA